MRIKLNWFCSFYFIIYIITCYFGFIDFYNYNNYEYLIKTNFMFSWILLQSYWWIGLTTVLYLYVFLSFLINYYTQNILINFFFLIYLFFMRDLFFNQFSLREINFFFFWSNDFLTNSLNQIHPPFFFLTIGCLLFYLIYNERWFSENNLFFFLKQVIIYPYPILCCYS